MHYDINHLFALALSGSTLRDLAGAPIADIAERLTAHGASFDTDALYYIEQVAVDLAADKEAEHGTLSRLS